MLTRKTGVWEATVKRNIATLEAKKLVQTVHKGIGIRVYLYNQVPEDALATEERVLRVLEIVFGSKIGDI